MSGKYGVFGIFFSTDENQIDIEEVKDDFRKYGRIAFVTQIQRRVYVNFTTKEEADKCLSESPNTKYGEMKRGKFGINEAWNPKEMNNYQNDWKKMPTYTFSKKTNERKKNSSRTSESESDETSVKSCGRYSLNESHCRESQIIPNSHSVPRPRASERKSMSYEFKYNLDGPPPLLSADIGPPPLLSANGPPPLLSANGPPPLLSANGPPPLLSANGPPPLQSLGNHSPPVLSCDIGPPPLISAQDANCPLLARTLNGPSRRAPLLPTPSKFKHYSNRQPMILPANRVPSLTSVCDPSDVPPPLVSAILQPSEERQECSSRISSLSYKDYVKKYGNYLLIINIPEDVTEDEIYKILYPLIPVSVTEPEVTNIRMRILFCLVTFKSKDEATKAAKQLDGVEVRGQCLNMIGLDELILFNDEPF